MTSSSTTCARGAFVAFPAYQVLALQERDGLDDGRGADLEALDEFSRGEAALVTDGEASSAFLDDVFFALTGDTHQPKGNASSAFVPLHSMPGWFQPIAQYPHLWSKALFDRESE